jgi:GTPase SAR1 family protein
MTITNQKIILDLTNSLSSGVIKPDSFLQTQAKKRLDELLDEFKEQKVEDEYHSIFDFPRYNNTIFVSGQRGAGKTTFLKAYLSELYKRSNDGGGIYPVALIDPTLVHTNQPILVEIITCLKQAFERQIKGAKNSDKYHLFREQLGELSEGLKLLKVKKEDIDQDAAWFLNKAIKNADSGHSLEKNLHKLIDIVLKELGKDLLVIAIDDVDNDTSKAHDVLETIRKYLTHPNIVIVVSGDLKIYSHIVRMKKLTELSTTASIADEQTNDLVEHLEQQYLVKVFPAEQRIHLKTLQDIISHENQLVYIKTTFSVNENNICDALNLLLTNYLKIDKAYISTYRHFIFEQPIRTILQLFKNIDFENASVENIGKFSNFIRSSYIGLLQKESINSDKLLSTALHQNDIGLADFKINSKYGELETGYYSRTDGEQDSYNASQLFLASVKSKFLYSHENSIGASILLMIATGATSNVYVNYVEEKLKEKANKQNYIDFIGINRYTSTTSLVPHFSPFILDVTDNTKPVIMGGIARLPRSTKPHLKFEQFLTEYYRPADYNGALFQRIRTLNHLIKNQDEQSTNFIEFLSSKTITMSSHSTLAKSEGRDYLSCYLLLSVIGELLNAGDNKVELNSLISKFGSIQTFSSPAFVNVEAQGNDGGDAHDGATDTINESNADLSNEDIENNKKLKVMIELWVKQNGSINDNVSFLLIGKVWSRIHYTLNSISEIARTRRMTAMTATIANNSHYIFLGELMTRWVMGIINSALIEEVRYKPKYEEELFNAFSKAKNVAVASNVLRQNLKSAFDHYENDVQKIKINLPFTYSLLMCPLLWPYFLAEVNNPASIKKALTSMMKNEFKDEVNVNILNGLFLERHEGLAFVSRLPIVGWTQ